MDKVTEEIAHFVGQFEIELEALQQRRSYEEFRALKALAEARPDLPDHDVTIKAPYTLNDFNPDIPYRPVGQLIEKITVTSEVWFNPPEIPMEGEHPILYPAHLRPHLGSPSGEGSVHSGSSNPDLPQDEPPPSMSGFINQNIVLSDDDYVSVGGHGLEFHPGLDHSGTLSELLSAAAAVSPIDDLAAPESHEDIPSFITAASARLTSFTAPSDDVTVVKSDSIEGTFLNGKQIDDADVPVLKDHVDFFKDGDDKPDVNHSDDFDTGPDESGFMKGQGDGLESHGVELKAGGNTLVNTVTLENYHTSAEVIAVSGDCVELNAIVQINAWCDADSIGETVSNWELDPTNSTESFNIAMFGHTKPEPDGGDSKGDDDFPVDWVVTKITGDLVMMNWINQYTFMSDQDTAILSSSGVKTVVTTGENTAHNGVSIDFFGSYYDLIMVGGGLYDANIIHQMNVLVDNDLVGAVAGFETNGGASASTSGNVLWNQAAIVDGSANFESMPDSYAAASQALAAGNSHAPNALLQDGAFAGLDALRVLYITGDYIKLNYVNQTNILGDSDAVAVAMDKILADVEAEWTIATGGNDLVNFATILNHEATDTIYLGGQHYTDEVLIQAELISADPELIIQDTDKLVNEAVAFLDDDPLVDCNPDDIFQGTMVPDNSQADPIQSMLG
jgi:hypothetical protein